jgi:hypothetical protein
VIQPSGASEIRYWRLGLILVSLAGIFLILYYTRTGAGIRGDSVRYVMDARNLLAGHGFSRSSGGFETYPETGFAPFLSYVLAAIGVVGINMYSGARVMDALLFGGSIYLIGLLIFRFTRSWLASLIGSGLALTAGNMVEWHAWLMSEPLFIFLNLLTFYALARYIDNDRPVFLVIAALVAGMASITRYAGVALAAAGGLVILVLASGSRKQRLLKGILFGAIGAAPFLLWMVRNSLVGGGALANRSIAFHPMREEILRTYLFEAASWIVPAQIDLPRLARALLAILIAGLGPLLFIARWLRQERSAPGAGFAAVPWMAACYFPIYIGVLAVNSIFLDAATSTPAAIRYLVPQYVDLVILLATTYAVVLGKPRRRFLQVVAVIIGLGLIINSGLGSIRLAQGSSLVLGFTGIREEAPGLAEELQQSSDVHPLITNNQEMVYFLIDQSAYMIPIKYDAYQQRERADFPEQLQTARLRMDSGSKLVIYGDPSAKEAEVIGLLGAKPIKEFPGATIYATSPGS